MEDRRVARERSKENSLQKRTCSERRKFEDTLRIDVSCETSRSNVNWK
jgi:hypothetical protein